MAYLNSLPSAIAQDRRRKPPKVYVNQHEPKLGEIMEQVTGPWWGPFIEWQATPVPKEKRWLRYGRDFEKEWEPAIDNFYSSHFGDKLIILFTSTISSEFADLFNEVIRTPGSFYSYGGYRGQCVVVVSPATGKVFYLFRG